MQRPVLVVAAFLAVLSGSVAADDWPSRPVKIIVPAPAGGTNDIFARMLAEHLPKFVGGTFIVENRGGAGGLIGAAAAAHASPDGYTLVMSNVAYNAIAPAVSANPGFDPTKDFTHIAYLGGPPSVFVMYPGLGVRSVKDLLDLAGKRSNPIMYVSPGIGTLGHLTAERFSRSAKVTLQHIPHRGGSPAMVDLVAGIIDMGSMTWTSALGQIRGGKVVPIAVTSAARLAERPDLPTFKELGYPDLVATIWYGLSGPAGVPEAIVRKLNAAVIKVLELPEVKARMQRDAVETSAMTPEQVTRFIASEIDTWAPLAKQVMQKN